MLFQKSEGIKFHNLCTATLRDAETNKVVQIEQAYNIVTDVGIRLMMDILGGLVGTVYNPISYGAVGTGATAAATTDVALVTELDRNPATYNRSGNTATLSVFFNTGDANGTLTEVGFFGGAATDTINTGTLFDRIVFGASITKSSLYTLTVEIDLIVVDT